ncbi:MAG: cyclic dehypoxanthinyl futalosine synthase [Bacteroidota bacterium]|nr:cyclic dehypoxanthinyl futalosine synthase [Bacteroidota bacterium]
MTKDVIKEKILNEQDISLPEAMQLWSSVSLSEIMYLADTIRRHKHPGNRVSWIIDRNINITNVCFSQCLFCNFCVRKNSSDAYVLSMDEYRQKIDELFNMGGEQILLQGGLHPDLNLDYYVDLFSRLKSEYPNLKLHALGPPEIVWLSKQSGKNYAEVLQTLQSAGLDSLPGAGAEILSNRVRKMVSPGKATVEQWLDVMREAHKQGFITSATMMFGFIESVPERLKHLILLRDLQSEKPKGNPGFIAFIPWPYQRYHTRLLKEYPDMPDVYGAEYLKMIAFSRIMLHNIPNIQASWLTVGKDVGAMGLHAGANDLGSVMIEENVVASAGAHYKITQEEMQELIRKSGFHPVRRNQKYEFLS